MTFPGRPDEDTVEPLLAAPALTAIDCLCATITRILTEGCGRYTPATAKQMVLSYRAYAYTQAMRVSEGLPLESWEDQPVVQPMIGRR